MVKYIQWSFGRLNRAVVPLFKLYSIIYLEVRGIRMNIISKKIILFIKKISIIINQKLFYISNKICASLN
jgi:hypothetical protein